MLQIALFLKAVFLKELLYAPMSYQIFIINNNVFKKISKY
jgi:hypothetical protein